MVPLVIFSLIYYFYPFRDRFEFNPDEGINAMKGLLLVRGYPLYSEIWSDQPPLFTYLAAATIRAFGHDINSLRILVLLLSTTLIGSTYFFLHMTWGTLHALAGVFLLLLLPFYNLLSVSVMIGLPSIAFAGFSLLSLTIWHQRHENVWLVLSAIALSLSILTKLFTGFLAPIFIVGILIDQKNRLNEAVIWSKLLGPVVTWSLVFTGITIGLGLIMVGPANVDQLWDTHLTARNADISPSFSNTYTITWYLRDSWAVLLLALIGTLFTLLQRNWLSLYLIAWAAIGYLLLNIQVPVWSHHQLLITIPIAMLAGIAVGEAARLLHQIFRTHNFLSARSLLTFVTLAIFVLALITLIPQTYLEFTSPASFLDRERLFMVRMTNHAPKTNWVVTDEPMYAFRIGRLIPPHLAVISRKRLVTGNLTEEQIIEIIDEYKPEQVMIGRFRYPTLFTYLEDDYKTLYSRGRRKLFLHKDARKN